MPKSTTFVLMICLVSAFVMAACTDTGRETELRRLDSAANAQMSSATPRGLDSLATDLLRQARRAGSRRYEAKAHFYLSNFRQGLSEKEIADKLRHLDEAERIANEIGNDTLLVYIYNQRGVYELSTNFSSVTSQYWFTRSMEKASTLKNRSFSIPAEMNMSEACRMNGDTIGIRYDRNLFDYAARSKKDLLRFVSGMHCAVYYADRVSDTAQLRPYIDAMRPLTHTYPGTIEIVYARFFLAHDDYAEAERFILRSGPDSYADSQILYAEILNKLGRYAESEEWIGKIIPHRDAVNFNDYGKMLRIRAENMAAIGNHEEAFRRQKEYEVFRDSVNRLLSQDLTKRYRIQYEVAVKDREISEQKMRIRNMWLLVSAIIFVAVCAAIGYWLWHRRQGRLYKDIVRQNREFIERQNIMSERIARRDTQIKELEESLSGAAPKTSKISDEKADEIFDRIQHLADEEQVWRDVNITREAFADMVGCNRTYFSEVLKAKTGMSYSQYMNSCRIREAVRVLSDPGDATPLKELSAALGFLTIQTFYSAFKQNIGMSPAAFRRAAAERSAEA